MSEETTVEPSAGGKTDRSDPTPTPPSSPDAPKGASEGSAKGEPRGGGPEQDGPVSESDALRSLKEGSAADDAERSEAQRAGAIADLIAQRLNADASGTRIGTLALFNDTVSFGGGFNAGGERHARAAHRGGGSVLPLGAAELVDHTELFVQPEGYDSALTSLCERRLLVLAGPSGSGREATAVNLLAEALALGGADGGGVCHRLLDPAAVLAPEWEPPVKDSGYLVAVEDGRAGARDFEALPRRLPAVVAALRAHGCHLVLTGGQDLAVTVRADGSESVAVHALAPVDPLAVLERRVLGHGGSREARAELRATLASGGVADTLREMPAARHAARLAADISAGRDVVAAAAALRDPSDQVRTWFDRHRNPEAVAFALAAAVLEDSGYLTVAEAAVRLRAALAIPEPAPPDVRFRDRLGDEQQWIRLDADSSGPPRVRFRNPLLGQVVLIYAWTGLDGWREALLSWLRRLLDHHDLEVRARAAVAAGILAWADHHYAVHRFLTTWAAADSWQLRQAAATALGVAGSREDSAEAVWELLHGWARGGSSARQRRLAGTAANTAGGLLGREAPARAVAVLHDALDRDDDWGTLPSVAWGGVHLVHQGRAGELLDAYLDWSEPQDLSPMVVKTLSAFLFATGRPYEPMVDGPVEGVSGVPLLLSVLPEHEERMAELWARSLARRPLQDTALLALRDWIDVHAERGGRPTLEALNRLLWDVSRKPGSHRERLLWWLDKWAKDRERPSRNAALIRAALARTT
ncbi:hypothetical protein ACFQ9H_00455 [Streptomyces sp. NPDC056517]|uniref:hypothetical protein n=1 Tax=Streptomyces sp. NPDC056517 TaxID=3345848 RepID=UPI0036C7731C